MFSRSAYAGKRRLVQRSFGLRQVVMFGCVLLAGVFILFLVQMRHQQSLAVSGELIAGAGRGGTAIVRSGSVLGWFFDYFGNVIYLMPLMLIYILWRALNVRSLSGISFFSAGLRLLGFNVLVVSLCSVLSSLFTAEDIGAGGILGDFLNIYVFSKAPGITAFLIPVGLLLAGVCLFAAASPVSLCERLGSAAVWLVTLGRDGAAGTHAEPDMFAGSQASQPDGEEREPGFSADTQSNAGGTPHAAFGGRDERNFMGAAETAGVYTGGQDYQDGAVFGPADTDGGLTRTSSRGESTQLSGLPGQGATEAEDAQGGVSFGGQSSREQRIEPSFGEMQQVRETASERAHYDSVLEPAPRRYSNAGAQTAPAYAGSVPEAAPRSGGRDETAGASAPVRASAPDMPATVITRSDAGSISAAPQPQPAAQSVLPAAAPALAVPAAQVSEPVSAPVTENRAAADQADSAVASEASGGVSTVITRGRAVNGLDFLPASGTGVSVYSPYAAAQAAHETVARAEPAPAPSQQNTAFAVPVRMQSAPYATASQSSLSSAASADSGFGRPRRNDLFGRSSEADDGVAPAELFVSDAPEDDVNVIEFSPQPVQTARIEIEGNPGVFVPAPADSRRDSGALLPPAKMISEKDSGFDALSHSGRGFLPRQDTVKPQPERPFTLTAPLTDPQMQDTGHENAQVPAAPENEPMLRPAALPGAAAGDPAGSMPNPGVNAGENRAAAADQAAWDAADRAESRRGPSSSISCEDLLVTAPDASYDGWRPGCELLQASSPQQGITDSEINDRISKIDSFFNDYQINARVGDYDTGPVITSYYLELDPGVRSKKIENVYQDLKRYLQVQNIRGIPVVEGKPYMALEVPNPRRKVFTLRDVVSSEAFQNSRAILPLCIGVNVTGKPVITDLAKAPHMLIAGTTGSGKSAGIHAMMLSMLLKRSPAEVRLIMVDPKRNEFSFYEGLPHLITPYIREPKGALAALKWCVAEMERRYCILEAMKVRDLSEYNARIKLAASNGEAVYNPLWSADMGGRPGELKCLPYIVVVIDELADLMMTMGRSRKDEFSPEALIVRLAQKARAAGIHLLLATQSPRSDVVTGNIKANVPSRVAYTVQNYVDSMVILGESGAEHLLGKGDMIAKLMDLNNFASFRAHGPLASSDDVEAVVRAWREHGYPEYIDGVTEDEDEGGDEGMSAGLGAGIGRDSKMYEQVVEYAREFQNKNHRAVSISSIQTNFSIGYPRAKRLHEQMVREGIIEQ